MFPLCYNTIQQYLNKGNVMNAYWKHELQLVNKMLAQPSVFVEMLLYSPLSRPLNLTFISTACFTYVTNNTFAYIHWDLAYITQFSIIQLLILQLSHKYRCKKSKNDPSVARVRSHITVYPSVSATIQRM